MMDLEEKKLRDELQNCYWGRYKVPELMGSVFLLLMCY
jgi:hypothetical protein